MYRLSRNAVASLSGALLVAAGTTSCQGLNAYSIEDDIALGQQAFQQVTSSEEILHSGPEVDMVERVTARLVDATLEVEPEIAPQFDWEVVVIDAPQTVNAFCLPGGKMAVYTGILPVTKDEAGLAVVISHEISHAIERHGTQRLTRNGLTSGLIQAVFQNEDHEAMASVVANLGVGMPWGRNDELEADREGLFIMAHAGYDPREAPEFWSRMAQLGGDGETSAIDEFLSTHPSNERRIEQLRELLPEVVPIYQAQIGKKQL